ncbi:MULTISPECIES: DUF4214 domain-containing protein [unclassified Devosia]|uniref:DUF4214 domain-containing protein n=1 Tax=unclassified Devosia TaxID=196773 RepID=UPI0015540056|nr:MULTISPECIES: DUF4214 domain-containing protein [unclassified Devosia]
MATIQEVYIALFGRPADPVGYQYYVEATDDGANLDAVGDLSASEEYTSRFEGMSDIDRVNQIYQDLFGRPADPAGLLFYVDLLQNGGASPQDIAIRILDGATGTDQDVIDNKVAAAQLFTDSIDTSEEILAYQGDQAAEAGRNFLDAVTDDPTTIPTQEEVDAALQTIVDNYNAGVPGDTFTLTTGIDEFTGTDDNDTFQANVGGADTTITPLDDIQGGAGTDTMNIVGAGGADIDPLATINGVEIINIATTAAVTNLSTESFEGAQQVWQIGVAGPVEVGEGVTAGFRSIAALAALVTVADGVSAATVALDDVTGAAAVTFAETTPGDLTSITVVGETEDGETLTLTGTGTETDLTLSLSSETTVDVTTLVGLTNFDASGSTGDLTLDLTPLVAIEEFEAGSGDDTVTLATTGLTASEVSFAANDGNDTFTIDAAAGTEEAVVTLEGGGGNDTFAFTALGNVTDEANFEDSLIVISDFEDADDVIDLAAFTRDILTNTELADIADEATLEDAIDVAGSYTTGGQVSVFDYDGDAYILVSTAGGDLANGDGLVQVVGFSVEDIDSSNFVFA